MRWVRGQTQNLNEINSLCLLVQYIFVIDSEDYPPSQSSFSSKPSRQSMGQSATFRRIQVDTKDIPKAFYWNHLLHLLRPPDTIQHVRPHPLLLISSPAQHCSRFNQRDGIQCGFIRDYHSHDTTLVSKGGVQIHSEDNFQHRILCWVESIRRRCMSELWGHKWQCCWNGKSICSF